MRDSTLIAFAEIQRINVEVEGFKVENALAISQGYDTVPYGSDVFFNRAEEIAGCIREMRG